MSIAALAAGCGSNEPQGGASSDGECDRDKVGDDCPCDDDDDEGEYECSDGELTCVCENGNTEGSRDDDDDDDDDDDAPAKDAGKSTRSDGKTPDSGKTPSVEGTGKGAMVGSDSSNPDAGSTSFTPPVSSDGPTPVLPEIKGECPEFKNGTIVVAGHKGVQLTVGEKGKGGALLFYWHGTNGSASQVAMFPAQARNEIIAGGGIIASFNGKDSSKAGSDCSGTAAHNMADFEAADQIVACAVKNHGIDPRRIYSTGCSAGGLQTGCMAMMRSSYLAAVAPNSGGVVFPQKWQDKHAPAVLTMHGARGDGNDKVVVEFADTSKTFGQAVKKQGGFVVNCDHGKGHCGASPELQNAAWRFMKDHPFGATPEPYGSGLPSEFPSYCTIIQ